MESQKILQTDRIPEAENAYKHSHSTVTAHTKSE